MEIIQFLQSLSSPLLDNLFVCVTILGEDLFYTSVLCLAFWCYDKKVAYKMSFALFFSVTLNSALKEIFNVARPIGVDGINSLRVSTATGQSFPSGHTQGTATFWTALMLHFKKKWLYAVSILIITLVGISRLYLGVHWPSDVIFGAIFGISSVLVVNFLFEKNKNLLIVSSVVLTVLGLFFFSSSNYIKTAAIFMGLVSGMLLEERYVNFSVVKGLAKQSIIVVIGIVGLLLIKVLFKEILPLNNFGSFIRYFLLSFWGIFLYPMIFSRFKIFADNQ